MTEFSQHIRAQADITVSRQLAEVEDARRVIATIEGLEYRSLDAEIEALKDKIFRQAADLAAATECLKSSTGEMERLLLRVRDQEVSQKVLREHIGDLRGKLDARITEIDAKDKALERRGGTIKKQSRTIRRLERELDVARGGLSDELESAGSSAERGVHKSVGGLGFDPEVAAVLTVVQRYPDGKIFTATDVRGEPPVAGDKGFTSPKVRAALHELALARFVDDLGPAYAGGPRRWSKLHRPIIRAAKRRGRRT